MEKQEVLLKDYSDIEKGAYLGAIGSIATADHIASEEETEYMMALADSAGLSDEQKALVLRAATEMSGDELKICLDILKGSDLKYSLVTDLVSFAESDKQYSPGEKANVEKIAQYLDINKEQFSMLDDFVKTTSKKQTTPEQLSKPAFLSSLGLEEKFKNSGINISKLTKGLLGVVGPMIIAGLVTRGLRGRTGGLGGVNPFGNRRGGLGSLISTLNRGRGFSSTGGLLGRMFGI